MLADPDLRATLDDWADRVRRGDFPPPVSDSEARRIVGLPPPRLGLSARGAVPPPGGLVDYLSESSPAFVGAKPQAPK